MSETVSGHEALLHAAVRTNAKAAANGLRHGSGMLDQRILEQRLMVLGAGYDLASGRVEFFDGGAA